jgi:hypothetical protein
MIENGSILRCDFCKKVAYIAKMDIDYMSNLYSHMVKTPTRECEFGEKIECENCGNRLSKIIFNSENWKSPE